jgi:GntR family transcriptional regulator, transcriptional repressor for pyruvate dehydrogenase complex
VPRMFEEVTRSIIQYIQEEKLERGTKLPPERKLVELLGVSRSSVREGLRILELLNYLESRQGGGTFVSVPPPFLIPQQIIKQKADTETLAKYFDIAIMNAEKIITLSLDNASTVNLSQNSDSEFWQEFTKWINFLGNQLENDYYLNLWNSLYQLLSAHDYFNGINVNTDVNDLKIAFYRQEDTVFKNFFRSLSTNASK